MFYNAYDYWGMHPIWWIVWLALLFWIFFTPYDVPGQRRRKDTPLEVLRQRFAAGDITQEEYEVRKNILEQDMVKKV